MTTPESDDSEERSTARPIVFASVGGPPAPDMEKVRERGLAQHEKDVRRATELTAQDQSGGLPPRKAEEPEKRPIVEPGEYVVRFDWRGETATYYEHDRAATLTAIYWGGMKGSVSPYFRAWEYPDGRRAAMTAEEQRAVLARVAEYARSAHGLELEIRDE
jgi:hypothetical protein